MEMTKRQIFKSVKDPENCSTKCYDGVSGELLAEMVKINNTRYTFPADSEDSEIITYFDDDGHYKYRLRIINGGLFTVTKRIKIDEKTFDECQFMCKNGYIFPFGMVKRNTLDDEGRVIKTEDANSGTLISEISYGGNMKTETWPTRKRANITFYDENNKIKKVEYYSCGKLTKVYKYKYVDENNFEEEIICYA